MSRQIVLQNRKVCHRNIGHGGILGISVFHDDKVAPPCLWILVESTLSVADEFVDGKRHAIPRDNGVENDIWSGELLCHAVKCLDRLQNRS